MSQEKAIQAFLDAVENLAEISDGAATERAEAIAIAANERQLLGDLDEVLGWFEDIDLTAFDVETD